MTPTSALKDYCTEFIRFGRRKVLVALTLAVSSAALSGLGLLLIIPLLSLVGVDTGASSHTWMANTERFLAELGITLTLPWVLTAFVLLNGVQAFVAQGSLIYDRNLQLGFVDHMRSRLYRAVTSARWDFYLGQRRSDIVHVLNHELSQLSQATYAALQVISTAMIALVYVGFSAINWPGFTLLTIVGTVLMFWPLRLLQQRVEKQGSERLRSGRLSFAASDEHLASLQLAKAHALESRELGRFEQRLGAAREAQNQQMRLQGWVQASIKTAQASLVALLVWYALTISQVSAAELLLLIYLLMRTLPVILNMQQHMHRLRFLLPAFQSIEQLSHDCEAAAEAVTHSSGHCVLAREIAFKNMSYSYPQRPNQRILNNITFSIAANKITALKGESGAGKSTLVGLTLGLLRPDAGHIMIDGDELNANTLHAWRSSIAYVPQTQYLFHESIRDNVRWMNAEADDEAIWAALEAAAAATFIRRLPDGLDTIIGDGGVRLSGGERQRIAIARALMRQPTLLVLDEATSELDDDNEHHIQQMLLGLKGQLTVLVIAHRQTSLEIADTVIEL